MTAFTRVRASINYVAADYPDLDSVAFRQALERAYYMGATTAVTREAPPPAQSAQSTVSFAEKHNFFCSYTD